MGRGWVRPGGTLAWTAAPAAAVWDEEAPEWREHLHGLASSPYGSVIALFHQRVNNRHEKYNDLHVSLFPLNGELRADDVWNVQHVRSTLTASDSVPSYPPMWELPPLVRGGLYLGSVKGNAAAVLDAVMHSDDTEVGKVRVLKFYAQSMARVAQDSLSRLSAMEQQSFYCMRVLVAKHLSPTLRPAGLCGLLNSEIQSPRVSDDARRCSLCHSEISSEEFVQPACGHGHVTARCSRTGLPLGDQSAVWCSLCLRPAIITPPGTFEWLLDHPHRTNGSLGACVVCGGRMDPIPG
eukprot:TRINITY_DN4501_c0_g1_i1.p1 TRINITY_DN4501_c0_g1~~TRINITY_DN4501_c0_g1_i1.p1  ORF type:complete len:294 (-),score=19.81 TRINITY_DN4501_c0_g1_i1:645-1526(-)